MDYRSMFDRKYVGAWDLGGKDVTVEIIGVKAETLNNGKTQNKKPIVYFKGTEKGFAVNKTNGKIIANMYGPNTDAWKGKRITLYPTMAQFGGQEVEAIRVRPRVPGVDRKSENIEPRPVDEEMRGRQTAASDAASDDAPAGREPGED